MAVNGIRVKIKDASGSYIAFRYVASNAQSRIKKDQFMEQVQAGIFDLVNPEILGPEEEEK